MPHNDDNTQQVAPIDKATGCYATDPEEIAGLLKKAKEAPHLGLILLSAAHPTAGGGKKPAIRAWTEQPAAALTESSLLALERQPKNPWNLGVRLDELVVLDRDRRNDPEDLADAAEERWQHELARARELGAPIIQSGGGGEHIYYRAPAGAVIRARYLRHPDTGAEIGGLEVKHGQKAQMVIPPSVHASGRYYTVLSPVNGTAADFLELLMARNIPVVPADLMAELSRAADYNAAGGRYGRLGAEAGAKAGHLGAEAGHLGAEAGHLGAEYGRLGGRPRKPTEPIPPENLDDEAMLSEAKAAFLEYATNKLYPDTGLPTIRGDRNNALYRLVLIAREYGAPDDPVVIESWLLELPGYRALKDEEGDKCIATIRSACAKPVLRGKRHPQAQNAPTHTSGLDRLPLDVVKTLHFTKDGDLRKTAHNLKSIIRFDPVIQASLRQEVFATSLATRWLFRDLWETLRYGLENQRWQPFAWDASPASILAYLSAAYGLDFPKDLTRDMLKQEFEYKLHSRGVEAANIFLNKAAKRLSDIAAQHNGDEAATRQAALKEIDRVFAGLYRAMKLTDDPILTAAALRMHLQASLKRIQLLPNSPPVQHDYCVILRGAQGAMKSTAVRHLSIFYADPETRESSAKSIQTLTERVDMDDANGYQFVVLEELTALRATQFVHENKAKDFITRMDHTVNPKYHPVKTESRRFVLWGTTNDDDFLTDPTGNRRFWVFSTTATRDNPIDITWIDANHEAIWTAVAMAERLGLQAYPNAQQEDQLMELASFYLNQSTATAQLEQWYDGLTVEQKRDLAVNGATIVDIIQALTNDPAKTFDRNLQVQLSRALKASGWFKDRTRQRGARAWRWFPPFRL